MNNKYTMSYNKHHYQFTQNPTMSYQKALNKSTMNKSYETNIVVDDIENYLEWSSKLITEEEFTQFTDINNTTATLQGMLKNVTDAEPSESFELKSLRGHQFLARVGAKTSFPLYHENTIIPTINLQTEGAVISVFTVGANNSNWETVWGIPLGNPSTFNMGKYGTHEFMVATMYDRSETAASPENYNMYSEQEPYDFWDIQNTNRVLISYSSFKVETNGTITTRLRLYDIAKNKQLCDVSQYNIIETGEDLNEQNRDKFYIFPLGQTVLGYVRYMKTIPSDQQITSFIEKLYNEWK